jgi:hypothetical protein
MPIATGAQLKEYLGMQGASDDPLLARLVSGAEQFFYMLTSRPTLEVSSFSHTLDGTGSDRLLIPSWPIVAVTSVVVDTEAIPLAHISWGDKASMDSRVIYLARNSGKSFTRGRRNVTVQGTFGYAVIPPEVTQAVLETAGRMYQKRKRLDEVSKQVGGETVTYSQKDLNEFAARVVQNYTNRVPL